MSRIEQLIGEIEEYIDGCKFQPLSNTKILVNKQPGCDSDGCPHTGRCHDRESNCTDE